MASKQERNRSRVTENVMFSQGEDGERWMTIVTPENVLVQLKIDLATGRIVDATGSKLS